MAIVKYTHPRIKAIFRTNIQSISLRVLEGDGHMHTYLLTMRDLVVDLRTRHETRCVPGRFDKRIHESSF